ncbi:MAG TPA: PP2C family serine/threonine-protein phosphatase [Opitutaceae bacterium]|nr:PP2C family serine/threonine-protein phosphatase [Opitutaceae bacterium]
MRIRTAALSDIGKVRDENEDRFLRDDERQLYAVADGIGGLAGGAQAAEEAINQLSTLVRALPADDAWDFQALFTAINQHVAGVGMAIDATFGIGTTLTAVRLYDRRLQLAHVGDSCCHLWRDGKLEKLTLDHTVENEMRARHGHGAVIFLNPRTRNALTRCIGQPLAPEADLLMRPLKDGDRLLLCSDGITRCMAEQELAQVLTVSADPVAALKGIIDLASLRGGHDNATGVLIFVDAV